MDTSRRSKKSTSKADEGVSLPIFFAILVAVNVFTGAMTSGRSFRPSSADGQTIQPTTSIVGREIASITACCNQAYNHSLGFFDDIPDDLWNSVYRYPAQNPTVYMYPDNKDQQTNVELLQFWIAFNWDPYFNCPRRRKLGGLGRAGKMTCDPDRLSRPHRKDAPLHCLVYSVQSGAPYSWEKALVEAVGPGSCEVHFFDPTAKDETTIGDLQIHPWGLTSRYETTKGRLLQYGYNSTAEFYTLSQIQQRLGHQGRVLDVLNVNCQGCEWYIWQDLISANVRQLLLSTHYLPVDYRNVFLFQFGVFPRESPSKIFDALRENHFVLAAKEVNSEMGPGVFADWLFVKMSPEFFDMGLPADEITF